MRQWLSEHRLAFTDEELTYAELAAEAKKAYPNHIVEGGCERIRAGESTLMDKDKIYQFSRDASVTIRQTIRYGELPYYEEFQPPVDPEA